LDKKSVPTPDLLNTDGLTADSDMLGVGLESEEDKTNENNRIVQSPVESIQSVREKEQEKDRNDEEFERIYTPEKPVVINTDEELQSQTVLNAEKEELVDERVSSAQQKDDDLGEPVKQVEECDDVVPVLSPLKQEAVDDNILKELVKKEITDRPDSVIGEIKHSSLDVVEESVAVTSNDVGLQEGMVMASPNLRAPSVHDEHSEQAPVEVENAGLENDRRIKLKERRKHKSSKITDDFETLWAEDKSERSSAQHSSSSGRGSAEARVSGLCCTICMDGLFC